MLCVELRQCGDRVLERAAHPPQRRCLFLLEFLVEQLGGIIEEIAMAHKLDPVRSRLAAPRNNVAWRTISQEMSGLHRRRAF